MGQASESVAGRIASIWRYPVKSMLGEEIDESEVTARGVLGDRAYALVDNETGKVASAKNPLRWPNMFAFRSSYMSPPDDDRSLPPARITLPDGSRVTTDDADIDARLSFTLGRGVTLKRLAVEGASAEGYWPDHDWLVNRNELFEFPLPEGTLFDGAMVHIVTTSSLDRLKQVAPASRFEGPRFRMNFVVETPGEDGFVENTWVGRTLKIGDLHLRIDRPTPRCIMTTLSQGDIPKDPIVLRAAVQENNGDVGVYATVLQGGQVRKGDVVTFA